MPKNHEQVCDTLVWKYRKSCVNIQNRERRPSVEALVTHIGEHGEQNWDAPSVRGRHLGTCDTTVREACGTMQRLLAKPGIAKSSGLTV